MVLVFDLCDRASFNKVQNWLRDLRSSVKNPYLVAALVGNKSDL